MKSVDHRDLCVEHLALELVEAEGRVTAYRQLLTLTLSLLHESIVTNRRLQERYYRLLDEHREAARVRREVAA